MGYLLSASTNAFEALWEGWQIGARPKSPRDIRMALKIEDKLLEMSMETPPDLKTTCPRCQHQFPLELAADPFVYWRIPTRRSFEPGRHLFLEDDEFRFLREAILELQPPQPKIRVFAELWNALDEAEKHRGSEPELRLAKQSS